MATLSAAPQLGGMRCSSPLSSTPRTSGRCCVQRIFTQSKKTKRGAVVVCAAAVAISNAQTREREKLKEMFEEAQERCLTAPMEGVSFTLEDFHSALDKYDFNSQIGTKG